MNPFALELGFADHLTRTRRDHMKYLTLIRSVALLHQHQRPLKTVEHRGQRVEYIEVAREDIAIANHLAHHVLGRSLDELPPQTRRLLELVHVYVSERASAEAISQGQFRFSRREVREQTGWSVEQLRVHLARLVELEYLVVHRGRRGQSFEYELVYGGEGAAGERFVLGLGPGLEPSPTISTWGGDGVGLPGRYRGQTGPKPAGAESLSNGESSGKAAANGASATIASEIASQERAKSKAS